MLKRDCATSIDNTWESMDGHLLACGVEQCLLHNLTLLSCHCAQATGYGVVEFAKCALQDKGDTLKGKRCLITGSGKVSGKN